MDVTPLFGLSILFSFIAFGVVSRLYIWPHLQFLDRNRALRALVVPHIFRFVGLSFLVPGVVAPTLSRGFAAPAAYGDLIALILALIATFVLSKNVSWAIPVVWIFNIWGTADFLFAFYQGMIARIDFGSLGAAFYIPTVLVPAGLILHVMIFMLLVRPTAKLQA